MKKMNELELQGLQWVQVSSWKRIWELRNEAGDVVARMTRPRWWSQYAEVDAPGNRWSFERKGFWKQWIEVKSLGTQASPARFDYTMFNGLLKFPDGRVFQWKQANFWGSKWAWIDEYGEPVIGFQTGGFLQMKGEMSLDPDSDEIPLFGLLVFLGWYLITLYHEDSAAIAASV
jgi:hypothetical protein